MNSLNNKGTTFGSDDNKITIFDKAGNKNEFEKKSKKEVAEGIVKKIIELGKY